MTEPNDPDPDAAKEAAGMVDEKVTELIEAIDAEIAASEPYLTEEDLESLQELRKVAVEFSEKGSIEEHSD